MEIIRKQLTLDYWKVHDWFEGRLREVPDMLSQGKDLEELEEHIREDIAGLVSDQEFAKQRGYGHLDAADIMDAILQPVKLNRLDASVAQLFVLSPDRREKIFAHIEDLVDLESLERRADEEDAKRLREEENGGEEEEW